MSSSQTRRRARRSVFSPTGSSPSRLARLLQSPWVLLILVCLAAYASAQILAIIGSHYSGLSREVVMRAFGIQSLMTIFAFVVIGAAIVMLFLGFLGPACPYCWRNRPAFVRTFQGRTVVHCNNENCGQLFVEGIPGFLGIPLSERDLELLAHVESPRLDSSDLTFEEMMTPTSVGVLLKTQRDIRQTEGWIRLLSYRGNEDVNPSRDPTPGDSPRNEPPLEERLS